MIAGAGVIGCSIAWHLAARGQRDVTVIDRHDTFGGGSTAKATGGFRAQFGTAVNVRLSLLTREKLLRFEDDTGADPGYEPRGYLFLATDSAQLEALGRAQAVQHACGLTEARTVTREAALALNTAVRDEEVVGGVFCPTDGFIRPLQLLRGYATAAGSLGVRFEFGRSLRFGTQADTDPGVAYVNAAGPWAAEVCDVPVTPLRRRVAGTEATTVLPPDMPMTIWAGDGFHLRVRDGRVLLLWPDTPPDDDRWLKEVLARAHSRIPALQSVTIDPGHCWSGLYEISPDHHAIVGRHPWMPNVYLANGSSGHGVMHAPAIGQLVAEMILDGRTSVDIHELRPSRFEEGEPVSGANLL